MIKISKRFLFLLFSLGILFAAVFASCSDSTLGAVQVPLASGSILVDQFGYRPGDPKIAVIAYPEGHNESNNQTFPVLSSDLFQVISKDDNSVIYEEKSIIWNDGEIHSQSGDRAALFDFSVVQTPGTYIIKNSKTGESSAQFSINNDVYDDVLVTAVRTYFYQRSGFPKHPPYADPRWVDKAAFVGSGQDGEARFVGDKNNSDLERDMRGGWFDAGDTNKYVTFAAQPIHQLLDAYSQNPSIWSDNLNLPESGNGIPDLLDEINYELDWIRRMQNANGSVHIKLGNIDFNSAEKPGLDRRPRFYGPVCSSSTIAVASMFAHAAFTFQNIPGLQDLSKELHQGSVSAWRWFLQNPLETDCDTQEIKSGDADISADGQMSMALTAAVYLFALNRGAEYQDFIADYLAQGKIFEHFRWSIYEIFAGDALLFYSSLDYSPNQDRQRILEAFQALIESRTDIYGDSKDLDPYLAYMPDDQYHWGSNQIKSNIGNSNRNAITYGLEPNRSKSYERKALSCLHYLHGVNPLGMVYLTNMYEYGAKSSANEIYHDWFGKGIYSNALTSLSGPAAGYLTGGPNRSYTGSAPISHLPPMKVYMDSNKGWNYNMWEITEPGIYYQSSYIKLLSSFVTSPVEFKSKR